MTQHNREGQRALLRGVKTPGQLDELREQGEISRKERSR
jgi:hypothetical protein